MPVTEQNFVKSCPTTPRIAITLLGFTVTAIEREFGMNFCVRHNLHKTHTHTRTLQWWASSSVCTYSERLLSVASGVEKGKRHKSQAVWRGTPTHTHMHAGRQTCHTDSYFTVTLAVFRQRSHIATYFTCMFAAYSNCALRNGQQITTNCMYISWRTVCRFKGLRNASLVSTLHNQCLKCLCSGGRPQSLLSQVVATCSSYTSSN